jgi:glutathione synthase/RimK-type ligase-like ATP-grasp enzyme
LGNWHCGEDKARFDGSWTVSEPTLFEEFIEGEAVRIVLVGEHARQVRMAGEGWLKSIHAPDAAFMPIDPELLDNARRLAEHFGLRSVGVDYMVSPDGGRYLLEVNHVPKRDRVFPEVREAYLDLVVRWEGGTV